MTIAEALSAPIHDVDDFLSWLQHQEGKFELVNGRIVAMAGGSVEHATIQSNLIVSVGLQLRGGPCRIVGSDLLLSTRRDRRTGRFPDAAVLCGPQAGSTMQGVVVLFEILSPDSGLRDRDEKRREYHALDGLGHYVLLWQNAMRAEVWSRGTASWMFHEIEGPDAVLELDPPGIQLSLAALYDGVELPPLPEPASSTNSQDRSA